MIKMLRKTVGGTWLKLKSGDNTREYWVRPSNPKATQMLKCEQVVDIEEYAKCLFNTQDMTTTI